MRFVFAILLLAAWPARSADVFFYDVMKSADIDAKFAKIQDSLDVLQKWNYSVHFRVNSKAGGWQTHPDADEYWFVRRGVAQLMLGDKPGSVGEKYTAREGDIVRVARSKAYQITPTTSPFWYVAVRAYPTERLHPRPAGGGGGAAGSPQTRERTPLKVVYTKSEVDAPFATVNPKGNAGLVSEGAAIINRVLLWTPNPVGPEEVHLACDDIYFKRISTARMYLDGTQVAWKELNPNELRAPKVIGAREYPVAPGDIISIPRNMNHKMVTGPNEKFGYVLFKVCD